MPININHQTNTIGYTGSALTVTGNLDVTGTTKSSGYSVGNVRVIDSQGRWVGPAISSGVGLTGSQGNKPGLQHRFVVLSSTGDPGAGNFAFNNSSANLVTEIYLSNLDILSTNFQSYISAWGDTESAGGFIQIESASNTVPTFAIFQLTAVTAETGYFRLSVSYIQGARPSNNALCAIQFFRIGQDGEIGYTGSRGEIGFTGSQGLQGTSISFRGSVPTALDLPELGNQINDAYIVQADGNLYIWNGSEWVNVGQIVGPQGDIGYTGSTGDTGYTGSRGEIGFSGSQGIQGDTGYTGSKGEQGDIGVTGSIGPQGPQGITGFTGSRGFTGSIGPQGPQGSPGFTGSVGPQGPQGPQGPRGYTGSAGFAGSVGLQGPQGPQGPQGNRGFTGSQGLLGYTGSQGNIGETGYTGSLGSTGFTGSIGPQGPQGVTGFTGSIGPQGPQGAIGFTGSIGPQGPQGVTGFTGSRGFTGSMGPQGPQGVTGVTGSIGPQGPQGAIGFTGSIGPQGPQGVTGFTGSRGFTGSMGPQGPQGVTGFTGSIGPQGPQGVTGFTGSTGPQGPQGAIGFAGSVGPQGPRGPQGPIGFTGSSGPSTTINAVNNNTIADQFPVFVAGIGDQAARLSNSGNIFTFNPGTGALNANIIEAGRSSGSVALTVNDGYGNANVTFNHRQGTPDVTGNSGRIVVNVDSTTGASMTFGVLSSTTANTAVSIPANFTLTESGGTFTGTIQGTRLISTISTGTAPLGVTSTTVVTNLNADLLDGAQGSDYVNVSNSQTISGQKTFSSPILTSFVPAANTYTGFGNGISVSAPGFPTLTSVVASAVFNENRGIQLTTISNTSAPLQFRKIHTGFTDGIGDWIDVIDNINTQTISGQKTFTSRPVIFGTAPSLELYESDQAVDNRRWYARSEGSNFIIQAINDAGSGGGNLWRFTRSVANIVALEGLVSSSPAITLTNASRSITFTGGTGTVGTTDAQSLQLNTNGTTKVIIDTNGRVGVGTSVPQHRLHIDGENNPTILIASNKTSAVANDVLGSLLFFNNDNSTGGGARVTGSIKQVAENDFGNMSLVFGTNTAEVKDEFGFPATYTDSTFERMRITHAGLIGIGTSTVRSQVHIYGTGQTTANLTDAGDRGGILRVSGSGSTAGTGGAIAFASQQGDTANSLGFASIKGLLTDGSSNTAGSLAFSTRNASTDVALTERMIIFANGNIGIGISTPGSLLHVQGTGTTAKIRLSSTDTGQTTITSASAQAGIELTAAGMNNSTVPYTPAIKFGSTDPQFTTVTPKFGAAIVGAAAEAYGADTDGGMDLVFMTVPSDPGATAINMSERMRIHDNGVVDITSPSGRMNLYATDGSIAPQIAIWGNGNTTNAMSSINQFSAGQLIIGVDPSDVFSNSEIRLQADGSTKFTVDASTVRSDVVMLVGKSTVGYDVAGVQFETGGIISAARNGLSGIYNRTTSDGDVIEFRRANTRVGAISVTTTATTYGTSSDYRLKEDLLEVENALSLLNRIKIYDFKFKTSGQRSHGVLAHELQEVIPYAVTGEKDGLDETNAPVMQHVDYSKMVPLLVSSLKEALQKIETLETRLSKLEK